MLNIRPPVLRQKTGFVENWKLWYGGRAQVLQQQYRGTKVEENGCTRNPAGAATETNLFRDFVQLWWHLLPSFL